MRAIGDEPEAQRVCVLTSKQKLSREWPAPPASSGWKTTMGRLRGRKQETVEFTDLQAKSMAALLVRGRGMHLFTEVVLDRPIRHVDEIVHAALHELGCRILQDTEGFVVAKTRWSWATTGEEICIEYGPHGSQVRVRIQSHCPNQIIDWGRNRSNENSIANHLLERLRNT